MNVLYALFAVSLWFVFATGGDGPNIAQTANANTATSMVAGTNHAET